MISMKNILAKNNSAYYGGFISMEYNTLNVYLISVLTIEESNFANNFA